MALLYEHGKHLVVRHCAATNKWWCEIDSVSKQERIAIALPPPREEPRTIAILGSENQAKYVQSNGSSEDDEDDDDSDSDEPEGMDGTTFVWLVDRVRDVSLTETAPNGVDVVADDVVTDVAGVGINDVVYCSVPGGTGPSSGPVVHKIRVTEKIPVPENNGMSTHTGFCFLVCEMYIVATTDQHLIFSLLKIILFFT